LSAGASSQTPLGELTALLQTLKLGLRGPSSKGTADRRGRERRGGRKGRGRREFVLCPRKEKENLAPLRLNTNKAQFCEKNGLLRATLPSTYIHKHHYAQ